MRHDERIAILQSASGRDAAGQPVEGWTPLPEIWANVQFPTGAAVMRAGQDGVHASAPISIVRASFRVWADPTIGMIQRVRHLGLDYKINAVMPDSNDRRFMFIVGERLA
jgi:SPP1 family predicted phage head-tail adaptor